MTFLSLWAQANDFVGLIQALLVLLLIVVPAVIKYFSAKAAQKDQQRLAEKTLEQRLHEAFSAVAEDIPEEPVARPRPKPPKKRKQTTGTLVSADDRSPTRGTRLSRELTPQGEGSRFDVQPGTLDGSLTLTPSVEPTVQPMLESMTGIYDTPFGSEQSIQTPLAVDIFQLLTTPSGIRQAVVLGEILKRPEF